MSDDLYSIGMALLRGRGRGHDHRYVADKYAHAAEDNLAAQLRAEGARLPLPEIRAIVATHMVLIRQEIAEHVAARAARRQASTD